MNGLPGLEPGRRPFTTATRRTVRAAAATSASRRFMSVPFLSKATHGAFGHPPRARLGFRERPYPLASTLKLHATASATGANCGRGKRGDRRALARREDAPAAAAPGPRSTRDEFSRVREGPATRPHHHDRGRGGGWVSSRVRARARVGKSYAFATEAPRPGPIVIAPSRGVGLPSPVSSSRVRACAR